MRTANDDQSWRAGEAATNDKRFSADQFMCLDEVAGYYISYEPEIPVSRRRIDDIVGELLKGDVELRILPELWTLANAVKESSLSFSLIRMRNAVK
jgi:hypothetical protein